MLNLYCNYYSVRIQKGGRQKISIVRPQNCTNLYFSITAMYMLICIVIKISFFCFFLQFGSRKDSCVCTEVRIMFVKYKIDLQQFIVSFLICLIDKNDE